MIYPTPAYLKPYYLMSWLHSIPLALLFFVGLIWIVLEFIWLGKFSFFIAGDNIYIIPYYLAFTENDLPFSKWTPFPAGGTDFASTGYSTILFRWIFSTFPSWFAIQILICVPIAVALMGTYSLCRKTVELNKISSVFASFVYGSLFFGGIFFVIPATAYIPFIIFSITNILDEKSSLKWWLLTAISVLLISQSSHFPRLVPWPIVIIVVWFLIIDKRSRLYDWGVISLVGFTMIALFWVDFIAIATYVPFSVLPVFRSPADFETVFTSAFDTIYSSISTQFFTPLGLLTLFFIRLYRDPTPIGYRILYALGAIIILLFVFSLCKVLLSQYFLSFNAFNITRIMQGFDLLVVIAGGFGFQYLTQTVKSYEDNLLS